MSCASTLALHLCSPSLSPFLMTASRPMSTTQLAFTPLTSGGHTRQGHLVERKNAASCDPPNPHPNNHHIINDTKKQRRNVCAHTSIPPRLESKHNPQYPMTLHLQHFGSYCCFFILPIRRDRPQHSRPGGKANRESCIDHAAAGQIERHVETNVTKRSQERNGRARDKTRGRPSLGWVSFCCPSGQRLYRAFQERRILSGNGKTFRHNLLGRDRRRDERAATPGWFSWSGNIF